jgi:oxygen-independent coproporphyrinogen-3 oxidase
LKETFKLGIQHISAYSLTIEEKTNLNYLITTRKISELEDVASSNHFNILVDKCQKKGFIQYEISNFSKKGFISRHNSAYWLGKEYLGIGPSAHSYNGKSRSWNVSSNKNYIESIQKGVLPFEKEDLSQDEIYNDYIMTSLRTIWGVDLDFIKQSFGQKYYTHLNQETQKWLHNGQIILESGKIYLSMKGKYISDNICADLFITD